jgi:hypothetical protein
MVRMVLDKFFKGKNTLYGITVCGWPITYGDIPTMYASEDFAVTSAQASNWIPPIR